MKILERWETQVGSLSTPTVYSCESYKNDTIISPRNDEDVDEALAQLKEREVERQIEIEDIEEEKEEEENHVIHYSKAHDLESTDEGKYSNSSSSNANSISCPDFPIRYSMRFYDQYCDVLETA